MKEPVFEDILKAKRDYYGFTEAAISFAAEEYDRQCLIYKTKMIDEAFSRIIEAKETILRQVIEKIEGRPAELSDAKNINLASVMECHPYNRQLVIYRGVHIGYIEVNLIEMFIEFVPI